MSDYRNPNDPMWQGGEYEPTGRSYGAGWGWLAGAVVVVILIAIVFGAGHGPTRTAMNENRPTAGQSGRTTSCSRAHEPVLAGFDSSGQPAGRSGAVTSDRQRSA